MLLHQAHPGLIDALRAAGELSGRALQAALSTDGGAAASDPAPALQLRLSSDRVQISFVDALDADCQAQRLRVAVAARFASACESLPW